MRILWLSWRDIKNPDSGGAEKVAIETASRFAKEGNSVTIFSSTFKKAKTTEKVRGVTIIRQGNQITCRFHAFIYYLKNKNFDIIIDEINTIPFFSVLYSKNKSIPLIHQLAKEYWFKETIFPFSLIGYVLEPLWLKLYSKRPTLALSNSTKEDLIKLGFKYIKTYNPGLDIKPQASFPQKKNIVLFVGRLTRAKNPTDAIKAFFKIHRKLPNTKLIVIGKGNANYVNSLKELAQKLQLRSSVKFTGYISDESKINFYKEAKVVLIPSVREGWNLVATEANATGCIPIGYNVPGLRNSILDGKTGILAKVNSPDFLADAALNVLTSQNLYQKLASGGLSWSRKFSWNKTFINIKQIFQKTPVKILWLSWRDINNPEAGGAEKVAIETASRFVRDGANVTIFTSRFKGGKEIDEVRGVKIIRKGNLLSCRLLAFFYYLKNSDFDLIIDEVNTIPFFSIFYAKSKTLVLIHQLAREYWFTQTIWPINLLGYILEPLALKLYKKRPTMVVSKSSKDDLVKLGFSDVTIAREGLDIKPTPVIEKNNNLILFIGRLTRAKGPQDAIYAFQIISQKIPDAHLTVIGKGEPNFVKSLKKLPKELVVKKVDFLGYVSDQTKVNLLKKAKIILIPSIREGWNLVATEANATGCIPVAYNVPGLQDSIKNNYNGILTEKNPDALAKAAIYLLQNEKNRLTQAKAGYEFSKSFSWENCYDDIKRVIKNNMGSTRPNTFFVNR